MSEIGEVKANILSGKQRVEAAREYATRLEGSYQGANSELLQAFKGLEKVLGHLGKADDRYRDEIKPRNAGAIVELTDASNTFVSVDDEWEGDAFEKPGYKSEVERQNFSTNEHDLQEGHTTLLELMAVIAHAKDTIQGELLPQSDATIASTPAQQTKSFADTIAPQIEASAQAWHDAI